MYKVVFFRLGEAVWPFPEENLKVVHNFYIFF